MNGLNERDIGNAISELVLNLLSREVHTAMPGKVHDVYTRNGRPAVDVKPLLKIAAVDGSQKEFQIATGVLLLNIGTSVSSVIMPVKKDDLVLLIYSERSLDRWTRDTKTADTLFGIQFDLSDAFAIPFNFSSLNIATTNQDLIVSHEGQTVTMKKNGDIEIGGTSTQALMTEAYKTALGTYLAAIQNLLAAILALAGGATPPVTPWEMSVNTLISEFITAFPSGLIPPVNSLTSKVKAE